MKTHRASFLSSLLGGLGLLGLVSVGSAQWVTQTIHLQKGWNAVHIRVQPFPAACDQVFANLPVKSVWRYNLRVFSTQFDTDPTDLFMRPDEWLTWDRSDPDSAYAHTLKNIVGGNSRYAT